MQQAEFAQELQLQDWLAQYPDLLPGDQIDPDNPREWLLVAREMDVPDSEAGSGRWSLDHLFLDQDGIPTFVECKRSKDTRTRREVVAQMLDYAANGIAYWSIQTIIQQAERTAKDRGHSVDELLREFLSTQDEAEIQSYWDTVEQNLRSGKVRLVFVADETPAELRRLVEFLNEKMENVEVLIVEIHPYIGEGRTAIVPRVIGMTEAARRVKQQPGQRRATAWTEKDLLDRLTDVGRRNEAEIAAEIVNSIRQQGLEIEGGRGAKHPSLSFVLKREDKLLKPFYIHEGRRSPAFHIQVYQFEMYINDRQKAELLQRMRSVGFDVSPNSEFPGTSLEALSDRTKLDALLGTVEWVIQKLLSQIKAG